jgi:hypothetical protein
MAEFTINTPIPTDQPTIEVTVTAEKPLPVGSHVFELVVEDDAGNLSAPDRIRVVVRDNARPTAVLEGPTTVNFGQPFQLSGTKSTDAGGGRVVKYIWKLVG